MKIYIKVMLIYAKALVVLGVVFLVVWLFYKDLVVSGHLSATYDFQTKSPFISVLQPNDRVEAPVLKNGEYTQAVIGDPVYFNIRAPQNFQRADVTIVYKSFGYPIVEIGALADTKRTVYDLQPLENEAINRLIHDKFHWSLIKSENTFFFQQEKKYESIEEFLNNLPDNTEIAVYKYIIDHDLILPNYSAKKGGVEINKTLRGDHRMYTYIKDEDLKITFTAQDLNRNPGEDHLTIEVYQKEEKLYSRFYKIDNNNSDDKKYSDTKEYTIEIPELSEGVYRIEVSSPTDDIILRRIQTDQDYLSFIQTVYLGDNVGFSDDFDEERNAPTKLYTDGHVVVAETTHNEGKQVLEIADEKFLVDETHKRYYFESDFGLKNILVEKNDLRLITKGYFSFTKESFLNPEFVDLSDGSAFDEEKIKYVIATYYDSQIKDGWQKKVVPFDVSKLYSEDGKLHMVFSIPEITEKQPGIELKSISVDMRRNPLSFELIKKRFKNIFRKNEQK